MRKVSENSFISKDVVLKDDVEIGPFVYIDGNVRIGKRTRIISSAVIMGNVEIGEDNLIYPNAVIGGEPQDYGYKKKKSYVIIGDNNVIREFVTIHRGTEPESKTIIGNNNFFMVGAHIAHNCRIGNNVTLINSASLAGYAEIGDNVVLSSSVLVHQFVRIGEYAMIAANCRVSKDIPPYMLAAGYDARIRSLNVVGLRRSSINREDRNIIKDAYYLLYHNKLNVSQALTKIKENEHLIGNRHVKQLINFIENSQRGITAHN